MDAHMQNSSIRFPTLNDTLLKEAYKKAILLNLNEQFIHLLEEEITHRQLENEVTEKEIKPRGNTL